MFSRSPASPRRPRPTPPPVALLGGVGVATGGGLVAAWSFAPVGAGQFAPVAMAMLWISLTGPGATHLRFALLFGLCFGLPFMLVLLWWLHASIGWAAWLVLSSVLAVTVAVAVVGMRVVLSLPGGPIWAAAVWVGVESLRSSWPLGGMPWGRLGVTAIDTPWQPLLPYAGTTGTGFLIATGGFAAAHACRVWSGRAVGQTSPARRWSAFGPLAAACAAVVAAVVWPHQMAATGTTTVAAVQGGVPGDGRDLGGNHRQVTRNHVEATVALANSLTARQRESLALVVWPENATAVDPLRDARARRDVERAIAAVGVPILVGGIVDGPTPGTAYNRGIVWGPDGPAGGRDGVYTKAHPVPFGEYIPWRSVIGEWSSRFDRVPRDMLPGQGDEPLSVGGLLVADAICFDVAYDDVLPRQVARGAQVVVVQTSNATFTGTSQPEQQFEISRARAVELGRSIVVASTNGVSGVIAADGTVVQRAPEAETATIVAEVDLTDQVTPAVRFQSERTVLNLIAVGVGLALVLLKVLCRRRPRARRRPRPRPRDHRRGWRLGDHREQSAPLTPPRRAIALRRARPAVGSQSASTRVPRR